MSLENDQIELRNRNIKFIKKYCTNFFKSQFGELKIHYDTVFEQSLMDSKNKNEILSLLKTEFNSLNSNKYSDSFQISEFNNIKVIGDKFDFDINELIKYCKSLNLVDHIYPTLEEELRYFTPKNFSTFNSSLILSSKRAYLKYLAKSLSISPITEYINKYPFLFNDYGFELLEYLNMKLNYIKSETVKFTIIYHFLNTKNYYKSSKVNYYKLIDQFKQNKELKFTRLDFDTAYNPKYLEHEQQLYNMYNEFQETLNY